MSCDLLLQQTNVVAVAAAAVEGIRSSPRVVKVTEASLLSFSPFVPSDSFLAAV
jgi:hypothetical protein